MSREKDKYIGYVETTMGVGDTLGPGLGGLIYAYFGYVGTFMAFSAFIYIGIVCSLIMIPSSLNQRVLATDFDDSKEDSLLSADCENMTESTSIRERETLTYSKIFTN